MYFMYNLINITGSSYNNNYICLQCFSAALWVKKVDGAESCFFLSDNTVFWQADRQLQIPDRMDYGCSKFPWSGAYRSKFAIFGWKFPGKKNIFWHFSASQKFGGIPCFVPPLPATSTMPLWFNASNVNDGCSVLRRLAWYMQ